LKQVQSLTEVASDDREKQMSTDKPKWDTPQNEKSERPFEAGDLAAKHSISPDRAQMLIDKLGHDPERLNAAAAELSPAKGRRETGQ
jgi:hypothetical protein